MTDEQRDPELEPVWADWQAPQPRADFHARVLNEFNQEFGRPPWWKRKLLLVAAVAAVGAAMAIVVLRPNPAPRYAPVEQPRFMIVSAGEHP